MKNKYIRIIIECILFFAVFVISNIVQSIGLTFVGTAAYALSHGGSTNLEAINSWIYINPINNICQIFTILTVLLIVFLLQHRKPQAIGFVKEKAILNYIIGLFIGSAMFIAAIGINVITGAVTFTKSVNFNAGLFVLYAIGWFFQGMAEETICRGFFLTTLSDKFTLTTAIIVNSAAFTLLHISNGGMGIIPFINVFLIALCFSIIFVKTKNIWLVSAMHSMWNFVQGNIFGILVSGTTVDSTLFNATIDSSKSLINGGNFGLEGGLAVTAVCIITIIIVLIIPKTVWLKSC